MISNLVGCQAKMSCKLSHAGCWLAIQDSSHTRLYLFKSIFIYYTQGGCTNDEQRHSVIQQIVIFSTAAKRHKKQ